MNFSRYAIRNTAATWMLATLVLSVSPSLAWSDDAESTLVIQAKVLHTMAGPPIEQGVVIVQGKKIVAIGQQGQLIVPPDAKVLQAEHVTPGLVDVRSTVGLTGMLNTKHDQDQLDSAAPTQPELRALDAYNGKDELVDWLRGFGVTTVHTGHGPGELLSGQTLVVKLHGNTLEESLLREGLAVVCTLGDSARKSGKASPGTRSKMMAMLRTDLFAAQRYLLLQQAAQDKPESERPAIDLRMEALAAVLRKEKALLVMADREQDIVTALRLAKEFDLRLWLESAAEAYMQIDALRDAKVPVLLHSTMARAGGEKANLSFTTAAKLHEAGIPFAIESGYEAYVPKVRVVLFEAGVAAGHGLPKEAALAAITIDAAKILGVADRIGSIELGKDADLALYDGDPLEYTSHCTATVIEGKVVFEGKQ